MALANVKVTLDCPVEKVWNTVTDLSNFNWRSDLSKIEISDEENFIEHTKDGIATKFHVTDKRYCQIWEFSMENENIKGNWCGKFSKDGDRTTLDFTENVTAKKLFLKPFVGAYLKKQQKQYLSDLKKELKCEEVSRI